MIKLIVENLTDAEKALLRDIESNGAFCDKPDEPQTIIDYQKKMESKSQPYTDVALEDIGLKSEIINTNLDRVADEVGISRSIYGKNRMLRPNTHCQWQTGVDFYGWVETNNHFKIRIIQELNAELIRVSNM